jgi:hypothetical protein
MMKHVETIKPLIRTLVHSDAFHALVIESAPGWGKSTTIDLALKELNLKGVMVGSYATPLHIYHMICHHQDAILIFDDSAGVFSDVKAMAILKAATWESSGSGANSSLGKRKVAWGSTSDKVEKGSVDFSGKIILLTNTVPSGKETEAFLSRCLSYRIRINEEEITEMLLGAASDARYFPDSQLAIEVAHFLTDSKTPVDLMKVNLRTLKMGYDLAATHPAAWRELFQSLLPQRTDSKNHLRTLFRTDLRASEEEARFIAKTGKSRRTYYNYKKSLGLTRDYKDKR